MKHLQNTHQSMHLEVTLLLPWYVNKTLQGAEHIHVETHLKSCLLCRIELSQLQKLSASVQQTDDITPVAQASFAQLMNHIHTDAQQRLPSKRKGTASWWTTLFRPSTHWIPEYSLLALTTVLIFAFSGFLPYALNTPQNWGNEFHTLSNSPDIITPKSEIRIVFSDHIAQEQINQILSSVHGRITSGPSTHGVYNLHIDGEQRDKAEILKTISLLRSNSDVIFAEPALSLFSSTEQNQVFENEIH